MPRRLIAVLVARRDRRCSWGPGACTPSTARRGPRSPTASRSTGSTSAASRPQQARAKLRAALLEPLDRPVSVRYKGRRFTLTPERAQSRSTSTARSTARCRRRAQGNLFTRTWREVRGDELDAQVDAEDHLVARGACASSSGGCRDKLDDRAARRVGRPRVAARSTRCRRATAVAVDVDRLRRDIKRELLDMGDTRIARVAHPRGRAEGHDRGAGEEVSGGHHRQPRRLPAHALQGPQAGQDLPHRGRPGRASRRPAGLYHIQNKAVNPAWHVPNSAWAGDLAGTVVPGGTPQNPLKARWMGIFAGAGIHGTDADGLDRHRRLARLHPDADPGRDRAVRPGPRRRSGLHRLESRRRRYADLLDATSCQPCAAGRRDGRSGECTGRR